MIHFTKEAWEQYLYWQVTDKATLGKINIFIGITLILPYLPFISVFGFVPLPAPLMLTMLGLTTLYVVATEVTKKYFYSRAENALV